MKEKEAIGIREVQEESEKRSTFKPMVIFKGLIIQMGDFIFK